MMLKQLGALTCSLTWVLSAPGIPFAGRLILSEAGKAEGVGPTAAAGAATVGVLGLLRLFRSAGDDLLRFGDDAVRAGAGASDDLLKGGSRFGSSLDDAAPLGIQSRGLADDLGVAAGPGRPIGAAGDDLLPIVDSEGGWAKLGPIARETDAARGLDDSVLRYRLRTDTAFRSQLESEIRLLRATRSGQLRIQFPHLVDEEEGVRRAATSRALEREQPILLDPAGRPIRSTARLYDIVNDEYRQRATRVFEQALDRLPPGKMADEQALAKALESALKDAPAASYTFDVSTGALKLLVKTMRGEISGTVNAYRVLRRGAAVAAALWHEELAREFADITNLPVDQMLDAMKLKLAAQQHAARAERETAQMDRDASEAAESRAGRP